MSLLKIISFPMTRFLYRLSLLMSFVLLAPCFPLAFGCEGCKLAASSGVKETQTVQAGIALSWSVLFLLAVVFLLLGILGLAIRNACLEAEQVHQASRLPRHDQPEIFRLGVR